MQAFTIPIGTSQNTLNLADGLPLFPKIGTSRAGISTTARSNPLADGSATVLFLRWKVATYYDFFMGVLGPAVSFKFDNCAVNLLNPASGGGEVNVSLAGSQSMVAGMAIGFVVGAGLQVTQEIYLPDRWYQPWRLSWHKVFDLTLNVELDFIKLLLQLIQYLLGQSGKDGLIQKDTSDKLTKYMGYAGKAQVAESFKFYAYSSSNLGPEKTISANPTQTIPFDLMSCIPSAKAFMRALAQIGGDVQLGPSLSIQMPVTLGLSGFTVNSATYSPVTYNGSTAIATGSERFSALATKFITNVEYSTGFNVLVSYFFKISLLKVFSISVNTASLNLLDLLGLKIPGSVVGGSVSTEVETGCILVPKMSMSFVSRTDVELPANNVLSGIPFVGEIFLSEPWDGPDSKISLSVTPELPGFPDAVDILHSSSFAQFKYTIANHCVLAGDFKDATVPPSATSPDQSYLVTATIPPNLRQPCSDWEVTVPVKLVNRYLNAALINGTPGLSPVWNSQAGVELNANPHHEPRGVTNSAECGYDFPAVPGETDTMAPITISLYDDERQLHSGSDVRITFDTGQSAHLSPSATLTLPIRINAKVNFTIEWRSKGAAVKYSTLFYLVLDGGCAYGRTELWLTLWNWS